MTEERLGDHKHTCGFCTKWDPETLDPIGPTCGAQAVQEIYWADGRVSPACEQHGLDSIDVGTRAQIVRIVRPTSEEQWATQG